MLKLRLLPICADPLMLLRCCCICSMPSALPNTLLRYFRLWHSSSAIVAPLSLTPIDSRHFATVIKGSCSHMWSKSLGTSRILPLCSPPNYNSILLHLFSRDAWALMAQSWSSSSLLAFARAAFESDFSSLPFFRGHRVAKSPNSPHLKHLTLVISFFFLFCCPRCHDDARVASSFSSFLASTPFAATSCLG